MARALAVRGGSGIPATSRAAPVPLVLSSPLDLRASLARAIPTFLAAGTIPERARASFRPNVAPLDDDLVIVGPGR